MKLILKDTAMLTKAAGKALASALAGNSVLTELDISGQAGCMHDDGPGFAKELAAGIIDMGALLHFDISDNNIQADGGKALMEALKGNQVITTLSIAENNLSYNSSGDNDMSGVAALADAIPGMGAMTKLIYGGDGRVQDDKGNWVDAIPATLEIGMTEADFSNKKLRVGGAIVVSAWLTHKDNGTMTSLSLASNRLGVEGAKIIAAVLPKCT
jgi:hypothetical protein